MYDPANDDDCTGFPPGESFPLVLISRGNGYSYDDYDDLGTYLAYNGFVVASVKQAQSSNYVANNGFSERTPAPGWNPTSPWATSA